MLGVLQGNAFSASFLSGLGFRLPFGITEPVPSESTKIETTVEETIVVTETPVQETPVEETSTETLTVVETEPSETIRFGVADLGDILDRVRGSQSDKSTVEELSSE